jgi:hypothetical protein
METRTALQKPQHFLNRLLKLESMREEYIRLKNPKKTWQATQLILQNAKMVNKLSAMNLN